APPSRDLRNLQWCSIDNDDSRDLDQLTTSENSTGTGAVRILVAVADVDALVAKATPIDGHAAANTTSVYTAAQIFPMLPERLSTDLTSLNPEADRPSLVIEYTVTDEGTIVDPQLSRALVRNQAKLAYDGVAAWLEGEGPLPPAAARVSGLEQQLLRQDQAAAGGAIVAGPAGLPGPPPGRRSAALPRSLAHHRQADGARRVRGPGAGPDSHRTLRAGGPGVRPRHRPQPPLPRPGHPPAGEG